MNIEIDYIGPFIVAAGTVIAIYREYKKYKRVTIPQIIMSLLLIVGLYVSSSLTYKSNKEKDENQRLLSSIETKNNTLIKNDIINTNKIDSLNTKIGDLTDTLLYITLTDYEYNKQIKKEQEKILFDNLIMEIEINLFFFIQIDSLHLTGFKYLSSFIPGRLRSNSLISALVLPLDILDKMRIQNLIQDIKTFNYVMDRISIQGIEGKSTNIDTLIRKRNKILRYLNELKKKISKYQQYDYRIEYF